MRKLHLILSSHAQYFSRSINKIPGDIQEAFQIPGDFQPAILLKMHIF